MKDVAVSQKLCQLYFNDSFIFVIGNNLCTNLSKIAFILSPYPRNVTRISPIWI